MKEVTETPFRQLITRERKLENCHKVTDDCHLLTNSCSDVEDFKPMQVLQLT